MTFSFKIKTKRKCISISQTKNLFKYNYRIILKKQYAVKIRFNFQSLIFYKHVTCIYIYNFETYRIFFLSVSKICSILLDTE